MIKIHPSRLLIHMAGLNVRKSGEVPVFEIQRSLPEKSSVLSILPTACCEGGKGGDIYYFGVCKGGIITRLAIADVTGHGEAVSEISQYVYDTLKAHIWDPGSRVILGEVNQRIL